MVPRPAVFFLVPALAFPSLALADTENLVDRTSSPTSSQPSGSIVDLFGAVKGFGFGSNRPGDPGCGPIINAAGNAVYVKREGCP